MGEVGDPWWGGGVGEILAVVITVRIKSSVAPPTPLSSLPLPAAMNLLISVWIKSHPVKNICLGSSVWHTEWNFLGDQLRIRGVLVLGLVEAWNKQPVSHNGLPDEEVTKLLLILHIVTTHPHCSHHLQTHTVTTHVLASRVAPSSPSSSTTSLSPHTSSPEWLARTLLSASGDDTVIYILGPFVIDQRYIWPNGNQKQVLQKITVLSTGQCIGHIYWTMNLWFYSLKPHWWLEAGKVL